MRRLAIVALALSSHAACYAPSLAPCTVRCQPDDRCPDEMTCSADRYCHPQGDTSTCPPDYFTVRVQRAGTGNGAVKGGGLDCGPLCDVTVPAGTHIEIAAAAESGSRFTGWAGACTGTGTCATTVTADLMIGAGFSLAKPLSVTFSGEGGGHVVSDPPGVDCTADCTALFDLNTAVTLTATPEEPAEFTGWDGACVGVGTCVVSMSDSMQVTADFN